MPVWGWAWMSAILRQQYPCLFTSKVWLLLLSVMCSCYCRQLRGSSAIVCETIQHDWPHSISWLCFAFDLYIDRSFILLHTQPLKLTAGVYNLQQRFLNSAMLLHWPVTQYRHKFIISLMHDRGFGLTGPHLVHAVYTIHIAWLYNKACDVKHTYTTQALHICYVYSSLAELVIVSLNRTFQSPSSIRSLYVHRGWGGHWLAWYELSVDLIRVGRCGFVHH